MFWISVIIVSVHKFFTKSRVASSFARIFAERLITLGKSGTLHHRRLAVARLRNKDMVKKLFDEIAPAYAKRQGGYTRIIKTGRRQGDAAEMCIFQLVEKDAE